MRPWEAATALLGGLVPFIDFFLPAHITGLACSMLLYSNDRLGPIALAAAMGIASKHLLCVPVGKGMRHVYNPSNLGITLTLLLFPWVGIAPPYHFTENLTGFGDWVLPCVIICTGTFLNTRFTKRLPLILTWLTTFVLQALVRHWTLGASLGGALMPMSGVAFILYTFYMATDPPTTPGSTRSQILFGASLATVYSLLMVSHIVFGLFFAHDDRQHGPRPVSLLAPLGRPPCIESSARDGNCRAISDCAATCAGTNDDGDGRALKREEWSDEAPAVLVRETHRN